MKNSLLLFCVVLLLGVAAIMYAPVQFGASGVPNIGGGLTNGFVIATANPDGSWNAATYTSAQIPNPSQYVNGNFVMGQVPSGVNPVDVAPPNMTIAGVQAYVSTMNGNFAGGLPIMAES